MALITTPLANPIQPKVEDSSLLDFGRQAVGELVRDKVNESLGLWIQPETISMGGKKYRTENKTFNKLKKEELDNKLTSLTAESPDEADGILYKLRNAETGEVKYGRAKDSVYQRYAKDRGFQRDWVVEYERPMKDIKLAERLIHGNKDLLSGRAYDYGSAENTTLQSGGSEVYKTDILKDSYSAVDRLLSDNQKELTAQVNGKQNQKPKIQEHKTETELIADPIFAEKTKRLFDAFGVDTKGKSKVEMSYQMLEELSGFNWNLGDTSTIAYKMQDMSPEIAQDFLDVMEAYDRTETTKLQVARGVQELASDPTTYVGIASLGLGNIFAQSAKESAKLTLKKALQKKVKESAAIGAIEGALYGITDDALKQSVEKVTDINKEYDVKRGVKALAVGATGGAVLGAGLTKAGQTVSKLLDKTKKNIKPKVKPVEESKVEPVKEVKEKPKARQVSPLDILSGKKNVIPTKEVKQEPIPVVFKKEIEIPTKVEKKLDPMSEDIGAFEPATKQVKFDIKPDKKLGKDIIQTKLGDRIESPANIEQQKIIESSYQKVVDPRVKTGKELKEQVEIPAKEESFKTKVGWDTRLRTYDEQGNLISSQGGTESKMSLALEDRPKITNIDSEINRIMKIYDNEIAMRKTYGESQARLRNKPELKGKSKEKANRIQFKIDNYYEIARNKNISKKLRAEAKTKAKELQKTKIRDYLYPEDLDLKIKEKYQEQFNDIETIQNQEKRNITERKKYEKEYKTPEFRAKKEAEAEDNKDIIFSGVEKLILDAAEDWKAAIVKAEEKSLAVGRSFDIDNPIHSVTDEVETITNFNNLTDDFIRAKEGTITPLELQHRIKSRIEDEAYRQSNLTFDTEEKFNKWIEEDNALRESVGLQKRKDMKFKLSKTFEGKYETPFAKEAREYQELQLSAIKFRTKRKSISEGTATLDKLEQAMKDNGYTPDEIASISTPITIKEQESIRREFNINKFTKEINNKKRNYLGTTNKWSTGEVKYIKPTDTTADFSNSVGQNVALSMGDYELASVTKLTGYSDDIRTKIAEKATEVLGRNISKDDIKPLFMTQLYGAMTKSLSQANVTSKENLEVALKEAKELFDTYDEIMRTEYEGFYKLSDEIYKLGEQSVDGKFSYKLPDDARVEFDLNDYKISSAKIAGKTQTIGIKLDKYNMSSRALMPNIMHSIDGYVIRQLQIRLGREGIDSRGIHDALTVKGENYDRVREIANDIQVELAESDILHDIMTQIGYKGEPLKKGNLDPNDVRSALTTAMDVEHLANKMEIAPAREFDNGRLLSEEDLIKEHMLSNNVKLGTHEQVITKMITEAGYNTRKYAIARDTDDVAERIMAEALQGRKLDKIEAPKEFPAYSKKLWDKVYEDMRNEARARAEHNPMLRGILQGTRHFFDENGNSLKRDFKSKEQIEIEEKRLFRRQLKTRSRAEREAIEKFAVSTKPVMKTKKVIAIEKIEYHDGETINIPDLTGLKFKIANKKKLTPEEGTVRLAVTEASMPEPDKNRWGKWIASMSRQINNSPINKQFMRLKNFKDSQDATVAQNRSYLKKVLKKELKDIDKTAMKKALLDTDYRVIRGWSKEDADKFMQDNTEIFAQAEKMILKNISGMRDHSHRVGRYLNSAEAIARESNLPPELADTIDKIITIKAMTKSDWDFVSMHEGNTGFELVMDILSNNLERSKDLLSGNSEDFIKGYYKEHYSGNLKIVEGQVMWDADTAFEEGVVPLNKLNKQIGTYEKVSGKGFKNREEMLDYTERNRRKVTKYGISRVVADKELRDKAGRKQDFEEILLNTTASIDAKEASNRITKQISDEMDKEELIFSREAKKDFIELTKPQREQLPYALREKVRWVHKDFAPMALGRDEPRLTSRNEQVYKIVDRLLADVTKGFKQNVVIKNIASIKNSVAVSITLSLASGVSPLKIGKYGKMAITEMYNNDKLRSQLAVARASGKSTKLIESQLNKSELYKMEQAGLATNKVEGVAGDTTLLYSMLSRATRGHLDGLTNTLLLNQGTKAGDALTKAFSYSDTLGRYIIAKSELDKGKTMQEAVLSADSLFGDMAQMAPALIDKIDKYGAIPFLKWFSETTPGLYKLTKENPIKVLGISAGYYLISETSGISMQSANPLIAAEDYIDSGLSAPFDTAEEVEKKGLVATAMRRLKGYILPATYTKTYSKLTNEKEGDELDILFAPTMRKPKYEKSVDLRNRVQKTIQGD